MYKNIRLLILIIAVIALATLITGTSIINKISWGKSVQSYYDNKTIQIDYFMESSLGEINSLVSNNAIWLEAQESLLHQDANWIDENLTKYIVDEENYNMDFSLLVIEDFSFVQAYGLDIQKEVEESLFLKAVVQENTTEYALIWDNGEPILLCGMPLYNNEKENPTGGFVLGRRLGEEELSEFKRVLGEIEVVDISISGEALYNQLQTEGYGKIMFSYPIGLQQENAYVNVTCSVPTFQYIFVVQKKHVFSIIITTMILVIFLGLRGTKKMSQKMILIIEAIEKISKGNYNNKIETKETKMFPEINRLIEAVNSMSIDIEWSIETIQGHVNTIENKYMEMVELMADAVELNDSYTYKHNLSVANYALLIGKAIGFKDLKSLETAARLHDVGKIAIPSHILNKEGKLTAEEYEIVKKHPMNGYKIISKIDYFESVGLGIKYHHERFDGKGYPEGLAGDEIPLIAQIISIADVYDALTSDRAYRKAMSYNEAMKIILNGSGNMFNEKLIEVFLAEMGKIRREKEDVYDEN